MDITIVLSEQAVIGWQHFLDTRINPARALQNLSFHTLESFFQEAEQVAGEQHYNMKLKRERYEALKLESNLTDTDIARLLQTIQGR
jgi:hypothetical protein